MSICRYGHGRRVGSLSVCVTIVRDGKQVMIEQPTAKRPWITISPYPKNVPIDPDGTVTI